MAMASSSGGWGARVLAFATVAVLLSPALSTPLDGAGFHSATCPQLESIVRSSVQTALQREVALAAGLLRIFFHDCFPQGCDASVLLSGMEQNVGPNFMSLRGFGVIDSIKAQLEGICSQTVSCADILTVAARDSVVAVRISSYDHLHHRLDSRHLLTPSLTICLFLF